MSLSHPTSRRGLELLQATAAMDTLDITIFMPCRNEQGNVGRALKELANVLASFPYSYEVIVIDDASSDGSIAEVEQFMAENPDVRVVLKKNPLALGVSYNFVDAAILGKGKYFRMIGGHFQDREETIRRGFEYLGKADIIITYMDPDNRAPLRKFLSVAYTRLVNFISGYNIAHYHGTPIHRRVDVLRWHSYRSIGFYADMTTRLLDEGISYIEIPTVAYQRETGKSMALRWRNVISVIVGFSDMFLRRFSKERIPPTRITIDANYDHTPAA